MNEKQSNIKVFISYSHKDEKFREVLEEHLAMLRRSGVIESWNDRKIMAGSEWKQEIDQNLESADLILLLVSNSFLASDYCIDKELSRAIARHDAGTARVVPIFVRPCDWEHSAFSGIQGLPKDAQPVTLWDNEDFAWLDVAKGLKRTVGELIEQKNRTKIGHRHKTLKEALGEEFERIEALYLSDEPNNVDGLSTGFVDLDRMLNGLTRGELITLASRPSMGKTNLSLQVAATIAEYDLPVLIFSLKLPARDVARRMVTAMGSVNYWRLSSGRLADDDWPKLTLAVSRLADKTVIIDDSPTLTLDDLREKCIRKKKDLGALPLIIIDSADYLSKGQSTEKAGRFLKLLAREIDGTIWITANASRALEARPNKRPVLADVHAFPDLVDESDIVLFTYIDGHYNPDTPDMGTAEIIVAKNKHGPVGAVRLSHFAQHGAFSNYAGTAPPMFTG